MKLHELQEKRAAAVTEMRKLVDKAEAETRDLSKEEATDAERRWHTANGATFRLRPRQPPSEYLSEIVYPSREIAEQRAREKALISQGHGRAPSGGPFLHQVGSLLWVDKNGGPAAILGLNSQPETVDIFYVGC